MLGDFICLFEAAINGQPQIDFATARPFHHDFADRLDHLGIGPAAHKAKAMFGRENIDTIVSRNARHVDFGQRRSGFLPNPF